ncbi:hypothetical protein BGZ47_000709 [Haplosporangium gracile]|nr:hypothetical protein BGZ47_000709 [Haplosporangium gracile]
MSPSSRLEARNQARAIPLVTVSLAQGHLRQTRPASSSINNTNGNNQSAAEQDLDQSQGRRQNHNNSDGDHPPSYDSIITSSSASSRTGEAAESLQESRLASPSNAALTEAVLHLSRTLITPALPKPRPQPSWLFMMIYSWTHTQKTATRLYHILTKPSSLLQHIQGQNDQVHHKKQRKSIQQITEEQDRMEDDPDMRLGAVTEMVPVSMMNTRSVAFMADEALLPSSQDPMELSPSSLLGDDFTEDSALPRKPKRRIESYSNPFAPSVNDMDPQEDDEGWLGMGEECSVDGVTKTNSVRLTSPTFSQASRGRIPEFSTSSLGPAMDPRQFENESSPRSGELPVPSFSTSSVFNRSTGVTFDRPSSRASVNSQSTASNYATPPSLMVSPVPSANSNRTFVSSQTPRQDKVPSLWQQQDTTTTTESQDEEEDDEHIASEASSIYHDLPSDEDHSSVWSDQSSSYREHHQAAAIQFPTMVRSSTASFPDASSIVISSSSPPTIIPPAISILSSSVSVRSFETAMSFS